MSNASKEGEKKNVRYMSPAGGGCLFCSIYPDVPCKYKEPARWREWLADMVEKKGRPGIREMETIRVTKWSKKDALMEKIFDRLEREGLEPYWETQTTRGYTEYAIYRKRSVSEMMQQTKGDYL